MHTAPLPNGHLSVLALAVGLAAPPAPAAPDFARDVLPVLQKACYECHGPDKQKGNLRLDSRAALLKGGDVGPALVPGKPDASELVRRVMIGKDDPEAMPSRGDRLTPKQVEALRAWVAAGAPWQDAAPAKHWAYIPPKRGEIPSTKHQVRNEIDAFVRARLEKEGLAPSPEAGRETLLRRVTLDLTGLPPTPAEVDAFLADESANAYERVVDRLLMSPQFGVKWARPWLDAARYADSHGFQRDDFRDLWPYRDWVVSALNADVPFDQFTVEQLAGDLLPNATEAQKVATGFNRSAPTNVEAGTEPEETRVNQVFDRVATLGTVWLGTSLECAQCHDHKYDPFSQKDFYRLFAFFNNTELEADRANPKVPGSIRFLGPTMTISDKAGDAGRAKLTAELAAVRKKQAARTGGGPTFHPLAVAEFASAGGADGDVQPDGSVLVSGDAPDRDTYTVTAKTTLTGVRGFRLDALTDPTLPGRGPGRGNDNRPNFVLTGFAVTAAPAAGGSPTPLKLTRAEADFTQAKFDPAGAIDGDKKTGWAIGPQFGKPHWLACEAAEPVGFPGGTTFTFTLAQDNGAGRTIGRFKLSAVTGDAIRSADPEAKKLLAEADRLEAALAAIRPPTTLVMKELPTPRPTRLLTRGDFRTPAAEVQPGTPGVLPPLTSDKRTRLELARWLVSRDNPLTARVTVNRLWAEVFGRGLVPTPEDFGLKGERPTHPELLDWLAVEFMDSGWSVKKLLRLVVTSGTYRQSSKSMPEALARDDDNELLARGPRFRLDAEGVRDAALAVAGLLNPALGGPPVRPYQPAGVWTKVGGQAYPYTVSPGAEKYRRGLYVVWKRGAPYPSMVNFDAPGRLACRVQRPRTNTPLQALTLLNDPVYVEAAAAFARRVLAEQPGSDSDRVGYAVKAALGRGPKPVEAKALTELLTGQRADDSGAKAFAADHPPPAGVAPAEFSAWYAVCTALLNLDETITKE